MLKLTSAFGLVAMIAIAWLLSEKRKLFPWRTVIWGIALQFAVGLFILRTPLGLEFFNLCQAAVDRFISFANEGNRLVFGPLAQAEALTRAFGPENTFVFVVTVTGTIILVAAISSLLYHYGILQLLVRAMAWVMRKAMRTSGSETLAAAANIFMGQTEAPLVVKPYLKEMTRSELLCLMVGGFATIAGGVLSVYAGVLKVPAGHLDHRLCDERAGRVAHREGAHSGNSPEQNPGRGERSGGTPHDQCDRRTLCGRQRRHADGHQCGRDATRFRGDRCRC